MVKTRALLTLWFVLAWLVPVFAQPIPPPGFIPQVTFANLPVNPAPGTVRYVTNTGGAACDDTGSVVLLCRFDGVSWVPGGSGEITGGTGDIEAVVAGSGLTGGGLSGSVTLNVGGTLPITVSADAVACPTCVTAASSLTANLPVIGADGQATALGTRSGNTTEFATVTGSKTTGKQLAFDVNGNVIASAVDVGGTGGGDDQIASEVPYAPADGNNWGTDPDDVAEALDQLALRVTAVEGDYIVAVSSAADPAVNDDSDDGYLAGRTLWRNTTSDALFLLANSTPGAAVWTAIGSGGSTTLEGLDNVTITSVQTGDVLTYTGAEWENAAPGIVAHNILSAGHTDTLTGTLVAGDILYVNNSALLTRLPKGSDGQFATLSSGLPAWAALPAGSTTQSGIAEAAIASEVDTGTDAARYVTPDALAGSTIFGRKAVQAVLVDFATDVTTGNGKFYFLVPPELNGMNLVGVQSQVITAGTTNATTFQITRCAAAATGNACSGTTASMLSTVSGVDSGENSSATAATPAVIDTGNDDVATGQILRFDVVAVSTTAPKGAIVNLEFALP